ncbi:MAG: peptide/nickel transport system ATP-binding protein [Halobacteriales archaeon]|jgi:peptide/nickel transport system ATP-binding protein
MSDAEPLLSVRDLHTQFETPDGTVRAVDGVSFDVRNGETVCLVGESGSGKTVTCDSLAGLVEPPGEVTAGEVRLHGEDLTSKDEKQLRHIRGRRIGYVFQNPQNALDSVYRVGDQVAEAVRHHRDVSKAAAKERAVSLLEQVGIPDAEKRADDYPHEFSGGMKQRVVVAIALASDPDLLVADEPTTALDVTMQASILRLVDDLQADRNMGVVFVTHDLGVVAEIADRVVVMYAGEVVERGDVQAVFDRPAHPYTRALFRCLPGRGEGMEPIPGSTPDPTDLPSGCRFRPRCPHAVEECTSPPDFHPVIGEGHEAACVHHRQDRVAPWRERPEPEAVAGGEGDE